MANRQRSTLSHALRTIFLPAFFVALLASTGQDAFGVSEQFRPRLVVNIPTVTFEEIVRSTVPGGVGATAQDVIDVPWLTNYIAGVYRYATSVAVVIAGVMFVVGAFQYLTAGGDAGRVSKGRERITNAVIGLLLVFASIVRLGFVANFISEPVLAGFKSGIGLVIVVDQIPKLLGIHITKSGFFRDILSIVQHVPETSLVTLLLALAVLVVIVGLERFAPHAPAPLVAIGLAIGVSGLLGLSQYGVAVIGEVAGGLPEPVRPRLDLVAAMWPAAAGIALMSFTESVAAARAFSAPGEPRPVPNRDLLAVGLANVAGGLLGAMPAPQQATTPGPGWALPWPAAQHRTADRARCAAHLDRQAFAAPSPRDWGYR